MTGTVGPKSLRIEDLSYTLDPENLEGTPREIRLGQRDCGRMLVVDRANQALHDSSVLSLPKVLKAGDVLILNNSKRIPGVLCGRTELGGLVECRFVDLNNDDQTGLCRIFPTHDIKAGSRIALRSGGSVRVLQTGVTKYELAQIECETGDLRGTLREQGLPISGFFYDDHWSTEHLNPYYATEEGSVESPLAGLHFTPRLVKALQDAGIVVEFVTLHSVGSWLPFLEQDVSEHAMWAERYNVSEHVVRTIERAKAKGGKVVACGSTSLRALETAAANGNLRAGSGRTELYITPGYNFNVVDAYFTNFHQFHTSMIVLDAAFAGIDLVKEAYREASARSYAFFEFGDAVLYV